MINLFLTNTQVFTLQDVTFIDWSHVDYFIVHYCDGFISCLDSHFDGTHSLQIKTNLSTSWMEYIFTKYSFLGELFL